MYIYGFTDVKHSIKTFSYNEYGQCVKSCYYGENGKLGDIEEGIAILRNSYDRYGRLITQEIFDANGNPVCGKINKFHKRMICYNKRGLIAEDSYFDDNNQYVNTPYLGGYCRIIYNYNERGILDSNASERYISIDGKAINQKEVNNWVSRIENRKVDGSLILANVEQPGLFINNGYNGQYCILEWNEWTMYDSITKFIDVFNTSKSNNKHLLIVPITEKGLGTIIDVIFPSGALGIRIMDINNNALFNDLSDIYESYKKTKK